MFICASCDHANPDDADFCQNCGRRLVIICAGCNTPNVASARFCKRCGQPTTASQSPISSRSEAVDRTTVEHSERRIVTILFCDIVSSTSIGERLDPEEWTAIMNGVFARLIPCVRQFGGTTSRLLGDAVLALFGAPVAHEDDALRAILAAWDMLSKFRPYRKEVRTKLIDQGLQLAPQDFNLRIGINTGLAIVGNIGASGKHEYTAMGDAVNLAARMEQTAEPGTIQIAFDTSLAVKGLVDLQPLPLISVKGKEEPVRTFRVSGLKQAADRQGTRTALESVLIGRRREIAELSTALASLGEGRGVIVNIIGEAGIGKSRLLAELEKFRRETLFYSKVNWFVAESFSFEEALPYGLIQRLLRRIGGIGRDDPHAIVAQKIAQMLQGLAPEQQSSIAPIFGLLMGQDDKGLAAARLGDRFESELFLAMRILITAMTGENPTILAFEDLHWSDSASIALIKNLLTLTNSASLMLVNIFRPYRNAPAWTLKQSAESTMPHRYQEIMLEPLSSGASGDLVRSLLKASELPEEVVAVIAEKTAGVPFYIEELISDLLERDLLSDLERTVPSSGIHTEHWQIPGSLEAVLVSRMDRLDPPVRRTIQLASVIGPSFDGRVLKMVSGDATIEPHLHTLQRAGLISESSPSPIPQYTFRHVLTQEAAYNTILFSDRRQYHRLVGEAIEQVYADTIEKKASLLAHHYDSAGEEERALQHFVTAAENAARLYANAEARQQFERALAIADGLPQREIVPRDHSGEARSVSEIRDRLLDRYAELLSRIGNHLAAQELIVRRLAGLSGDRPLEKARLQLNLAENLMSQYLYDEGAKMCAAALDTLSCADNHRGEEWYWLWLEAKMSQSGICYWTNDIEEMIAICEDLREPIEEHGTMEQKSDYLTILVNLNNRRLRFAPSEESVINARRKLEIEKQIGNKASIAFSIFHVGFQLLFFGELDEADDMLSLAYEQTKELGTITLQNRALAYLSVTLRMKGDERRLRKCISELKASATEESARNYLGTVEANEAWLAYRAGQHVGAQAAALAALGYWNGPDFPFQWLSRWLLVELALTEGDLQTAVDHAQFMIRPDQHRLPDAINDRLALAVEKWRPQGDRAAVAETLVEAVSLAKALGYL